MILLEQNKPREVMAVLERAGLRCDVVRSASADEERLHVLRAVKGGDRCNESSLRVDSRLIF